MRFASAPPPRFSTAVHIADILQVQHPLLKVGGLFQVTKCAPDYSQGVVIVMAGQLLSAAGEQVFPLTRGLGALARRRIALGVESQFFEAGEFTLVKYLAPGRPDVEPPLHHLQGDVGAALLEVLSAGHAYRSRVAIDSLSICTDLLADLL